MKRFLLFTLWGLSSSFSWGSTLYDDDLQKESHPAAAMISKSTTEKAVWGIAESQLDELFQTSSNLVCLAGGNLFSRVNAAWTKVLGWSEQELLTRPYADDVHPEDQGSTKGVVAQGNHNSLVHGTQNPDEAVPKNSIMINFENRRRSREGEYRSFQWLLLLQVSGSKTQAPMLCIGNDITEQKQAQEQKLALERAQAATKLKSTFVAHMSHEIRTPLNGILGFIELALDEQMSDKVRSYLQYAHDSALLLLEIANDIIDVSRIEAGALKVEKVDFNPASSLENVFNILQLQAQKKNLRLKSVVSESLPAMLTGDQSRLKQILLNLGNNAIKFTPQGKVTLTLDGYPHPQQSHLFMLRGQVKDTGMGMESSFIDQLFQPFSQEDRPMNRQFGGAGLGLYITKQLCEKMGGSIQVLSTPGIGSTFQFQILLEQSNLLVTSVKERFLSLSSVQLPLKDVLVVDDNMMNQKVLEGIMTHLGCHIDLATNGLKALEAIRHKTYDLILMDGEMPYMDGLEATQEIRKQFSAQQLPIIGLTAHAMTTHRDQFLASGMNGYLTKPINRQALIDEILRCCQKRNPSTS